MVSKEDVEGRGNKWMCIGLYSGSRPKIVGEEGEGERDKLLKFYNLFNAFDIVTVTL